MTPMLRARIPRTCVWQGVERYRPGGCLRNHALMFSIPYRSMSAWHAASIDMGPMRDLLLAVLKDEMLRSGENRTELRRLEALYDALAFRRSVDLGFNPTFWRIVQMSVGPDRTARMARILQVLH